MDNKFYHTSCFMWTIILFRAITILNLIAFTYQQKIDTSLFLRRDITVSQGITLDQ